MEIHATIGMIKLKSQCKSTGFNSTQNVSRGFKIAQQAQARIELSGQRDQGLRGSASAKVQSVTQSRQQFIRKSLLDENLDVIFLGQIPIDINEELR